MDDFIGSLSGGIFLLVIIILVFFPNAIIGAYLAHRKNRSTVGWFFLCIFFPFYALILIAGLPEKNNLKYKKQNDTVYKTSNKQDTAPLVFKDTSKPVSNDTASILSKTETSTPVSNDTASTISKTETSTPNTYTPPSTYTEICICENCGTENNLYLFQYCQKCGTVLQKKNG